MTDRPKRRYLTGTARAQLAADLRPKYEAGTTVRQLAEETGYSYGNVAELLRLAGTEMRPKGFQPKNGVAQ
ncbi:MAG: transcriptional regulator [Streptomyces sp.]|nr:transcriptional regulator [Streptomyces sp.]